MTIQVYNPAKSPQLTSQLIRIYGSRLLLYGVCFLHVFLLFAILLSSLRLLFTVIISIVVLAHLYYVVHRWHHQAIIRLQRKSDAWYLIEEQPPQQCSKILEWHFCARYLIVLVISDGQRKKYYKAIFFDSCLPNDFRRLKVISQFLL